MIHIIVNSIWRIILNIVNVVLDSTSFYKHKYSYNWNALQIYNCLFNSRLYNHRILE